MAHQSQTVKYMLYCILFQLLASSFVTAKKRVNFHAPVMSADEVIAYIKSFIQKSSLDMKNEKQLMLEDYAEDLYNKIGGLMSQERYLKLLEKTKDITDKDGNMKYLISSPQTPCNPSSIFKPALQSILKDLDKSNMLDELEKWQMKNEHLPDSKKCNRFKGLTCQDGGASSQNSSSDSENSTSTATCQCDGDPSEVGFFKPAEIKNAPKRSDETYPEGCYVKPWKPCTHLFSQHSSKTILAQIIFPVGRTNKCKDGSNCLDLIPGITKPICWCNAGSLDEECLLTKNLTNLYIPPLDTELMGNRRKFIRMVISASDKRTVCNPEYNKDIIKLVETAGMNPCQSGAVAIMEKLVHDAYPGKKFRICDFRKALLCDAETRTCKQHLSCGKSLCAPNHICGEKNGSKICMPDCTSPIFEGSAECSEDLVKRSKGRNLIDGVEISDNHNDGLDPAASHNEAFGNVLNQLNDNSGQRDLNNNNPADSSTISNPNNNETMIDNGTTTDSSIQGPNPHSHGTTCKNKNDCDHPQFLTCYGETCECMIGLEFDFETETCQIPTNGPCGESSWSKMLVIAGHALGGIPTTAARCHSKDICQKVNGHYYCRPRNQADAEIFSEKQPCQGRTGSYAGILQSSKFLVAVTYILYIAI